MVKGYWGHREREQLPGKKIETLKTFSHYEVTLRLLPRRGGEIRSTMLGTGGATVSKTDSVPHP